jgi:hypothetical protein
VTRVNALGHCYVQHPLRYQFNWDVVESDVSKRKHSLPFKLKAIARALKPSAVISDVADKLEIHPNLLRQWIAAAKLAFPKG